MTQRSRHLAQIKKVVSGGVNNLAKVTVVLLHKLRSQDLRVSKSCDLTYFPYEVLGDRPGGY